MRGESRTGWTWSPGAIIFVLCAEVCPLIVLSSMSLTLGVGILGAPGGEPYVGLRAFLTDAALITMILGGAFSTMPLLWFFAWAWFSRRTWAGRSPTQWRWIERLWLGVLAMLTAVGFLFAALCWPVAMHTMTLPRFEWTRQPPSDQSIRLVELFLVMTPVVWLALFRRSVCAVFRLPRILRVLARYRYRLCQNCGYDIRGLRGSVCPECGRAMVVRAPRDRMDSPG